MQDCRSRTNELNLIRDKTEAYLPLNIEFIFVHITDCEILKNRAWLFETNNVVS